MANTELTRLEQDIAVIEQTLNAFMEPGLAVVKIDDFTFESAHKMDYNNTQNNTPEAYVLDTISLARP